MVKLFCAIVGAGENTFSVQIDPSDSVHELKKAIKEENTETVKCDAKNLNLFLAKTEDGTWLQDDDTLDTMLHREVDTSAYKRMRGSWKLNDPELLGTDVLLKEKVIHDMDGFMHGFHVLVGIPKPKRPAEDECGGYFLKRLKIMETKLVAMKTKLVAKETKLVAMEAFRPRVLDDFKILSVSTDEFQLDSLSTTQQSNSPIVRTPDLHEFWEGIGDFPSYYFVRMEEMMFWKVIKKMLFIKDRVVIVGSPGVGKSCFLMLIAFYLACIENKKVLVIRRLKQRDAMNAVVFFDGHGSYARLTNLSPNDLFAIRRQAQGAIVLVDGFNQNELSHGSGLLPFAFLATSCQFDAEHDDSARVVVLPAWSETNLLQYAKLSNWVIDTGLKKIKQLEDATWSKLVKEQYFYSGGSLREFNKERERLKLRAGMDWCSVGNAQTFDLVYNYGQNESQLDRLRRHYISDCLQEEHYSDPRYWKLCVDSGYLLSELGRMVNGDKRREICKYAESGNFDRASFELLLHNS